MADAERKTPSIKVLFRRVQPDDLRACDRARKIVRPEQDASVELYNLADDIGEKQDFAPGKPAALGRMTEILESARTPPRPPVPFNDTWRKVKAQARRAGQLPTYDNFLLPPDARCLRFMPGSFRQHAVS